MILKCRLDLNGNIIKIRKGGFFFFYDLENIIFFFNLNDAAGIPDFKGEKGLAKFLVSRKAYNGFQY